MRSRLVATCFLAAFPALTLAHDGPRIWLGQEAGKIVTYTSDDDFEPTTFAPSQVFAVDFDDYGSGIFATDFPGFEARTIGNSLASNTTFGFDLAGPFLKLDPASSRLESTLTSMPSPAPRLAISESANGIVSSTGVLPGFNHFTYIQQGNHAHLFFTLLGDGTNVTDAADGVYAAPMILHSPTLARSDWIVVLFNKNGSAAELAAAASFASRMVSATPGDTNFDGSVDFDDLLTLAQQYGTPTGTWWADGDFDFNGNVNFDDLLALAQHYGENTFADWARARALVPEPSTLFVLPLLCRRRRA